MRLRVATLNVWGLPEPLSPSPTRRLRAIGKELASLDLDVIAFQEVWFAGARQLLIDAGAAAGLRHAWSPDTRIGGSGLLVLSRHPIESARLAPFLLSGLPERVSHGDYYGGKGYVHLRLATPAGPVAFVDTHLHARYASEVSHAYMGHRAGQVVQLALGSRETDAPLLVAGDFNFVPRSEEHQVLRGLSGLRDLAGEMGDAAPTVVRANPFRAGSSKPDRRVDFVFGRDGDGVRIRTVATRRVFDAPFDEGRMSFSNHAGVWVEVEIERDAGAASAWRPDPAAMDTARRLLADGRRRARQRRRGQRTVTGTGLGVASLVALTDRHWVRPRATRRRFLRLGLQSAAAAALMPSLGCSVLSEVFVPGEIAAYDRLRYALDRLDRSASRAALRSAPTLDSVETT